MLGVISRERNRNDQHKIQDTKYRTMVVSRLVMEGTFVKRGKKKTPGYG